MQSPFVFSKGAHDECIALDTGWPTSVDVHVGRGQESCLQSAWTYGGACMVTCICIHAHLTACTVMCHVRTRMSIVHEWCSCLVPFDLSYMSGGALSFTDKPDVPGLRGEPLSLARGSGFGFAGFPTAGIAGLPPHHPGPAPKPEPNSEDLKVMMQSSGNHNSKHVFT